MVADIYVLGCMEKIGLFSDTYLRIYKLRYDEISSEKFNIPYRSLNESTDIKHLE